MSEDKKYIFQTGHGKGLARAEIAALFGETSIKDEVENGFLVTVNSKNPVETLNRMGGIVRITEVLQRGPANMPLNFEEWLVSTMEKTFKNYQGKIRFGLSMHPKSEKILKKTLQNTKKTLQSRPKQSHLGNIRFVNKDFQNLSSVQAWHERLLERGAMELHLFKSESYWYLSKTLAIQDFEWYSKRDYERPAKNTRSGMFPPKLAQILINLALPKMDRKASPPETDGKPRIKDMTVYDPFCGSGTVLQEAWLMGYKAWGSDLEVKQVASAKKNMDWLKKMVGFQVGSQVSFQGSSSTDAKSEKNIKIFEADACRLLTEVLPPDDFVIVTETWLGPRFSSSPSEEERRKAQSKVEALLEAFFHNLKSIVQKPTAVVFTAPFHKEQNQRHFLPHLPQILAKHAEIILLSTHERPSLFYERKDQIVAREIWKVMVHPVK